MMGILHNSTKVVYTSPEVWLQPHMDQRCVSKAAPPLQLFENL